VGRTTHARTLRQDNVFTGARTSGCVPRRPRDIFSRRYRHRIGYEGEYYLIRKLNDLRRPGYYAVRTPGSGTGKLSLKPDVLAVDNGELCAIEVKSTNKKEVYIPREQLERLLAFSRLFVVRCPSCGHEIRPKPIIAVTDITGSETIAKASGGMFVTVGRMEASPYAATSVAILASENIKILTLKDTDMPSTM